MKTYSASYINGRSLQEIGREELELLCLSNSAFLWGDSAFTSGLIEDGKLTLWAGHRKRLLSSCDWLYDSSVLYKNIEKKIFDIIKLHHNSFTGKFRVTLFYDGTSKKPSWSFDLSPLDPINEKIFITKINPLSLSQRDVNVKVGSYADVYQLKRQYQYKEDICLVNDKKEIIEGMHSALLFWHKDKSKWVTPQTSDYKLESIGLHYGLESLDFSKEVITISGLSEYSAAFSVNAVYKAVPIGQINDIKFSKSKEMTDTLINMWSKK